MELISLSYLRQMVWNIIKIELFSFNNLCKSKNSIYITIRYDDVKQKHRKKLHLAETIALYIV
jgi:hypothetical protein